jgi:hypothetical protein
MCCISIMAEASGTALKNIGEQKCRGTEWDNPDKGRVRSNEGKWRRNLGVKQISTGFKRRWLY